MEKEIKISRSELEAAAIELEKKISALVEEANSKFGKNMCGSFLITHTPEYNIWKAKFYFKTNDNLKPICQVVD